MSNSALASITAQYTDSENEDEQGSPESQNSQASQVIIPKSATPIQSPAKPPTTSVNSQPTKRRKRQKKLRRLVSYQDDTMISDEEEFDDSTESSEEEETDTETEQLNDNAHGNRRADTTATVINNGNAPMEVEGDGSESNESVKVTKTPEEIEKLNKFAHYNFKLPPEPKGKPSTELDEKIKQLYEKMEKTNMDMNRIIQNRKEFRNPSIYEKLIQYCDINEFGTNYPPEIYDPLQWGPESFYEELARVQQNEMMKRKKERRDMDKIEQATALARKVEEEAKKRKSKWDQPAAPVKSGAPPALTTTVTGTKGTVISAFGSLPKKSI